MMTQTDLDVFYPAIEVSDSPTPKPIPTRLCACKCGHRFQPRRSNQKYINKQHADFGYNCTSSYQSGIFSSKLSK